MSWFERKRGKHATTPPQALISVQPLPPYKPKGGILTVGTNLQEDPKNPKNWGRSGIPVKRWWVSDIYHSEITGNRYYVISFEVVKSYFTVDNQITPENELVYETRHCQPQTEEEVFDRMEIVDTDTE